MKALSLDVLSRYAMLSKTNTGGKSWEPTLERNDSSPADPLVSLTLAENALYPARSGPQREQ